MTNGIVIGLSTLAGVWLGWWAIPICLVILGIVRLIEWNPDLRLFLVCLFFASIGALRHEVLPQTTSNPLMGVSTGAIGKIKSFPIASGDGHRTVFNVQELCVIDQCFASDDNVLVYIARQHPALHRGQLLRIDWRIDTLENLGAGYRSYVASQGAEASARVTSVQEVSNGPDIFRWIAEANAAVTDRLASLLPGDAGALATGIVTGNDSGLETATREQFQLTNTSHLTAVSGQNVSLILGFLSLWYAPKTSRGRWAFHIVLIAFVWAFTIFVGMESPALRAAIVATLMVLGKHVGRRSDPVTILSMTLGAMVLIRPLAVHSVGFWLSAVAAMALCLVMPGQLSRQLPKALREIMVGPMAASLATMPITLAAFSTWSPIGILANMLLAPIVTLVFPIAYLFALIAIPLPWLARWLSWIPGILLDFILVIVDRLAPIAVAVRIDRLSPAALILVWTPILLAIWLMSTESDRWIRRAMATYEKLRDS